MGKPKYYGTYHHNNNAKIRKNVELFKKTMTEKNATFPNLRKIEKVKKS